MSQHHPLLLHVGGSWQSCPALFLRVEILLIKYHCASGRCCLGNYWFQFNPVDAFHTFLGELPETVTFLPTLFCFYQFLTFLGCLEMIAFSNKTEMEIIGLLGGSHRGICPLPKLEAFYHVGCFYPLCKFTLATYRLFYFPVPWPLNSHKYWGCSSWDFHVALFLGKPLARHPLAQHAGLILCLQR